MFSITDKHYINDISGGNVEKLGCERIAKRQGDE